MTGPCQENRCARRRGGGRVADRSTRGIFHVHSEFVPVQTCYDNYKAPQAFARAALPPTRQSARKSMTQTSQEIRVLVVDDSPVSRKLLEQALALDARTDPLTGLANRRAVEEWSMKQICGAVRHGYPIWVVLSDLDSYKPATDLFGHGAGDSMLQAFSEILKKNTRVSDLCGHMGGDQFILVISHVTRENMNLVLNRLREKIANYDFSFHGTALPLFANFGMAGSEGGEQLQLRAMLQQADAALLEAKRTAQTPRGEAGQAGK